MVEEGMTFNLRIEISLRQPEKISEAKIQPFYTPPKTTNPHFIQISFDGKDYSVPKTTGGL